MLCMWRRVYWRCMHNSNKHIDFDHVFHSHHDTHYYCVYNVFNDNYNYHDYYYYCATRV